MHVFPLIGKNSFGTFLVNTLLPIFLTVWKISLFCPILSFYLFTNFQRFFFFFLMYKIVCMFIFSTGVVFLHWYFCNFCLCHVANFWFRIKNYSVFFSSFDRKFSRVCDQLLTPRSFFFDIWSLLLNFSHFSSKLCCQFSILYLKMYL